MEGSRPRDPRWLKDPQALSPPIRALDDELAALPIFIDDEVVEGEGAADDFSERGGVRALLETLEEGLRLRGQVEVQANLLRFQFGLGGQVFLLGLKRRPWSVGAKFH